MLRFWNYENRKLPNCVRIGHTCQMFWRECRNPGIHQSRPLCRFLAGQTFFGKIYCMFFIMAHGLVSRDRNASGCAFTPQSRPDPFHCHHIARWSARSGTTGRSGSWTGGNTGARLHSRTIPVPKVWCEHGLILWDFILHTVTDEWVCVPSGRRFDLCILA